MSNATNDAMIAGLGAGAAGTAALNVTTYLDMAIRGRPSSEVPTEVASEAAARAGVELSDDEEQRRHRAEAMGQLFGYGSGLALGAAYGAIADRVRTPPWIAGLALGLGAMATSDVAAVALDKTDPRSWGVKGWAADLVPHLLYGFVTVGTFALWSGARRNRR